MKKLGKWIKIVTGFLKKQKEETVNDIRNKKGDVLETALEGLRDDLTKFQMHCILAA